MSSPNTRPNNEQSCSKEEVEVKIDSDLEHKFLQLVSCKTIEYKQARKFVNREAVREYEVVKPIYFQSEDSWKLLSIFPEKLWTLILGHMKNRKDMQNCEQSCQLFRRILHDYKKQWMFPDITHLVHKFMTKADLLTSRLVCREWRQGVDTFFENAWDYGAKNQYWPTAIEQAPNHWKFGIPQFDQVYNIPITPTVVQRHGGNHLFIGTMDHQQNPFIGRTVRIYSRLDLNEDEQAQLLPLYHRTFDELGSYIRHLSVRFGSMALGEVATSPFLLCSIILNECPNIKSFYLDCSVPYVPTKQDESVLFPNHSFLESLRLLSRVSYTGQLLIQLVEKYHSQIKRVRTYCPDFKIESSLPWNELTSLRVNMYAETCGFLKTLGTFCAPNLRMLSLDLWGKCKTLHELMTLLQRFPKLEFVKLDRCSRLLFANDAHVFNLPHEIYCSVSVKELHVEWDWVAPKSSTFQFLRCFPLLNKLKISHDWHRWRMEDGSVKFVPGAGAVIEPEYFGGDQENYNESSPLMLKSNVWEVLPDLDRLENYNVREGTRRVYTRKQYLSSKSD